MSAILACAVALAWLVVSPASANAQPTVDATLQVAISESTDGLRSAAVAVDPGTSGLSALTAEMAYDPTKLAFVACSVSEAGACNNRDGLVKMSAFNLDGLSVNDRLLTVDFQTVDGATGSTTLSLRFIRAAQGDGKTIDTVSTTGVDFIVAPAPDQQDDSAGPTGSLTGDVTDASTTQGLFGMDVCASQTDVESESCTQTNGWGAFRIDDLAPGEYSVSFADAAGVYETATASAVVHADEITTGVDADLLVAQPDGNEPPSPTESDAPIVAPKEARYDATITGTVTETDPWIQPPVQAAQVCATQPIVLFQRCATTDENGQYEITGLTAGNYWVRFTDPLDRFDEGKARLVGVTSDEAVRTGIDAALTRAS